MKKIRCLEISLGIFLLVAGQLFFPSPEAQAGPVLFKGRGYAVSWMKRLLTGPARAEMKPLEHASLIFKEGVVYGGTSEGKFYALSADTGNVIWMFQSDGSIESEPAIDGDVIYFGNSEGTFYALNADTGELLWFFSTGGINFSRPVFNGDNVVLFNNENRLFSLNKLRGEVDWIKTIETEQNPSQNVLYGSSAPIIQGDKLWVGISDGSMACLSLAGELIWKKNLSSESDYRDIDAIPVISSNVLISPSFDGFTYGIKPETGDILWKIPGSGNTGGIVTNNNSACLPLHYKDKKRGDILSLTCLSPSDGEKIWESENIKSIIPDENYGWNPTIPIMLGNKYIIGLSGNGLVIINNDSQGKIAGFLLLSSGITSKPSKGEGRDVFVFSNDGYLYKIYIL